MLHLLSVCLDSNCTVVIEGNDDIRQKSYRLQEIVCDNRHEYIQLEITLACSESDSSSAAETTAADSSAADESSTDADSSSDESSDESSDDSSTADESSVVYGNYEIEAEDGVDSACADVIKAYFTAIEEQDFNAYKATLYDYYYNVYNDWLQDNQGYGMETTMEQMHQSLLDSAGGDHLVVTGITVKLATAEGNADEVMEVLKPYLI